MIFRMAGEGSSTGPKAKPATSGEPTAEQEAAEARADRLAAYGLATPEPAPAGGDPGKEEPEQKSEAKPEGDPSKQPPTGQTGPDGKPTTQPEKKLLAGKYENLEALELGHHELQSQYSKIVNEKKAREAELLKEIEELKSKGPAAPPDKETEKPVTTPAASIRELVKTNPKMAKVFSVLSESLGEGEVNALSELLDTALESERGRYSALEKKLNEHERAMAQVTAAEQERIFREFEFDFAEQHPEYKDPDIKAECEKITKEISERSNDPRYLLELQLYAAKGRLLPQLVDKLLSKRVNALSKEEINKMLSSGILVGGGVGPGSGGGAEGEDQRTKNLRAYGMEPK